MINIKTPNEIEIMQKGGKMLSEVMWELVAFVKEGVSEIEIDKLAQKLILEKGGEPGFKKVDGYKYSVCFSTNDVVVHGIPTDYRLKEGDVIGIDCGVFYNGFHTDMSETVIVGKANNSKTEEFLKVGKIALEEAIKKVVIGNHVGDISKTIQDIVEDNGYSVVEALVGHGVGRKLHEEPEVPGFLMEPINQTPLLREGMVIAVEVIYNMGKPELKLDKDGWTLRTKDGSLGGLYERTVAITSNGPLILTP
ncbi:MAG: type I methionyl aminopeptidase [Patescibacteria group bacterium]